MKQYKDIFIDLDNTLWDFKANSYETIQFLFNKYKISDYVSDFESFYKYYQILNAELWDKYRKGKIEKSLLRWKRFNDTFDHFGLKNEEIARNFGEDYVEMSPQKTKMFPYSIEIVQYLSKKYRLHVLTNGFKEVQYLKLNNTGLINYFTSVLISEELGYQKPNALCFEKAMEVANAKKENSIMIGDDLEIDILGAKNAGMDQILYNHENISHKENITYEVNYLKEIENIL